MPASPEGLFLLQPVLARGARRDLPPGTLWSSEGGPLWKELRNLGPREGRLKRREGVDGWMVSAPTVPQADTQEVRHIFRVTGANDDHKWILVTTDDIFWGDENGWINVTPTHSDGTVSVTNGTNTVTGSGTSWVARGIQIGNLIELPLASGDFYEITAPFTATSLTLTTNYTGTTLSGASYQIRRLLALGEDATVFFALQNENAYLAGLIGGNGDLAVYRLTNALGSIASGAPNGAILVSGLKELESGIDSLGYQVTRVLGLEALQDGRFVVPVHWADSGSSQSGNQRELYSSHLSDAVWTTSPGGATDIQGFSEGLTALVSTGRSYEFHFRDGVSFGELTGQDDPPLDFSSSAAKIGALSPTLHARIPGGRAIGEGTLFVGEDLNLYLFSGISSQPLDLGFREELEFWLAEEVLGGGSVSSAHYEAHARHDPKAQEVEFFFPNLGGTTSSGTPSIRVNYDTGELYSCFYPGDITASVTLNDTRGQRALIGTRSEDQAGSATDWVYELVETVFNDSQLPNTTDEATQPDPEVFAWSDEIDFGNPFELDVVKEIGLWFDAGSAGLETVKVLLERDGVEDGSPLTASVTKVVGSEVRAFFYPSEASMAILRVKILSNDGDTFTLRPTRMVIFYEPVGDVRCV